ncbi:metal ABC transporter permease [Devriesea agamarum]|uniref:metal ABC transporter permease n=1 Tax=Devriesea agamarum TaxID=472569 RepID=UPI00071C7D47|nr:metal ABC transporter permease [Devriesea agamarum]
MDILHLVHAIAEPFTLPFMQRALWVGLGIAVVCGLLSCFLVHLGWSLIGDGVSHAVLPGVVLAYALGLPFAVGALIFALIAVGLIGGLRRLPVMKEDASIGIVFTTLFSLGLVLISITPSSIDLGHILFGNLLGIADSEIVQVALIGLVVLVVLAIRWRDFRLMAFDSAHAGAIGLRVGLLSGLMLALLALTVTAGLQAVGVILVVAMLITPGAAAAHLTHSFARMAAVAASISALSVLVGLEASFHLDVSPAGTIVLVQGVVFALCAIFGQRGVIARLRYSG